MFIFLFGVILYEFIAIEEPFMNYVSVLVLLAEEDDLGRIKTAEAHPAVPGRPFVCLHGYDEGVGLQAPLERRPHRAFSWSHSGHHHGE